MSCRCTPVLLLQIRDVARLLLASLRGGGEGLERQQEPKSDKKELRLAKAPNSRHELEKKHFKQEEIRLRKEACMLRPTDAQNRRVILTHARSISLEEALRLE